MKYKYRSQLLKRGKDTNYELYIQKILHLLELPYEKNMIICFKCNNRFSNFENQYPKRCKVCFTHYGDEKYQYCMPDFVLTHENKKAIIYVNGKIHEKANIKRKDEFQIKKLQRIGFKVFVVTNEEIDYLRHANRVVLVKGLFDALVDDRLYELMYQDEKEIIH